LLTKIAVAAATVSWTNGSSTTGAAMSCGALGCNDTPRALVAAAGHARDVAVNATSFFWTDGMGAGVVSSCPLAGCAGAATELALARNGDVGIEVEETGAFWGDFGGSDIFACSQSRCGEVPSELASQQAAPFDVAIDTFNVYFPN
jgi:hypothetical protein